MGNTGDDKTFIRFGRKKRSTWSTKRNGFVRVGRIPKADQQPDMSDGSAICEHTVQLLNGIINFKLQQMDESAAEKSVESAMAAVLQGIDSSSGADVKRNGFVRVGRSVDGVPCQQSVLQLLKQLIDVEIKSLGISEGADIVTPPSDNYSQM